MKFDPDKPVRTKEGCKARIICKDREGKFPIIALVVYGAIEAVHSYNEDGTIAYGQAYMDLVNVPEYRDRWFAIANLSSGPSIIGPLGGFKTKKEARQYAERNAPGTSLFSIQKFRLSEGEGLT